MANDTAIPAELLSNVPPSLHSVVKNFWFDWCASCAEKQINSNQNLPLSVLGKTWACSDFIARNYIRYPVTFCQLHIEGFESKRTIDDYKKLVAHVVTVAKDENKLMSMLRELRQQEMVRIAWRDLNVLADTKTIIRELTDFAEAIVSAMVQEFERQQAEIFGMPRDVKGKEQALLVFAMGKMGGGELNFSSDIDLIFIFPEDGETSGQRKISHYEFYLAIIRKLVKVLDEVTANGFVYRVDTRLRPFGESGPMAMSFAGIEQYYQSQGRDWERYAMIKAKLITGRSHHKKYLQSMLTPFVYRRYLDFSMFESIREMKAMINTQMKRKRMSNNIKLGTGGIREIEFIGQTLQLIRAGREPELRERSIINVLALLAEKNYLQKQEVAQLIAAYWFLRKLENRLQIQNDKQTHTLPDEKLAQQRLCLAMQVQSWDVLLKQLTQHQNNVDVVFQNLIAGDNETQNINASVSPFFLFWANTEADDDINDIAQQYFEALGYSETDAIIKSLIQLRDSAQLKHLTADTARLLAQLMDSLLEKIVDYPKQAILFDRVCRVIKALAGRKVYISLLSEYSAIQLQMLTLCSASEWFTERLTKYPILLDSLFSTAEAFRRQYDIEQLLALELKRIERDRENNDADLELQMDRMRQFKRKTVFSIAMLDVFYEEAVETVSDHLTDLANVLLSKILKISWQAMVEKYGEPGCVIDGVNVQPAISIIAYGKMGGNELGYGSDLDIIFLHNSAGKKQQTKGEKSIDNQVFFVRVAQRVIHFLNTRTYSGILYEADTRLRPDGQSGLLVSSIAAFENYQKKKAWTWEHQALIRARFVTDNCQEDNDQEDNYKGNTLIEPEFDRIRSTVLRQKRDTDELLQEVVKMREKMREHLTNKSASFDIKQDAGGLVDIEFMTQAGVLIHAEKSADCIKHTATLGLINALKKVDWYTTGEAKKIAEAYRYFRKLKNWQNLACEADESDVPMYRENVLAVWDRLMPKASEPVKD